jgi:hypothetical protein
MLDPEPDTGRNEDQGDPGPANQYPPPETRQREPRLPPRFIGQAWIPEGSLDFVAQERAGVGWHLHGRACLFPALLRVGPKQLFHSVVPFHSHTLPY